MPAQERNSNNLIHITLIPEDLPCLSIFSDLAFFDSLGNTSGTLEIIVVETIAKTDPQRTGDIIQYPRGPWVSLGFPEDP